jgi:hypothetical protein
LIDQSAGHRGNNWKVAVADALSEPSREKLSERIAAAEAAVFERLQVVATNFLAPLPEVRELCKASQALLALKTDVLKFPRLEATIRSI